MLHSSASELPCVWRSYTHVIYYLSYYLCYYYNQYLHDLSYSPSSLKFKKPVCNKLKDIQTFPDIFRFDSLNTTSQYSQIYPASSSNPKCWQIGAEIATATVLEKILPMHKTVQELDRDSVRKSY